MQFTKNALKNYNSKPTVSYLHSKHRQNNEKQKMRKEPLVSKPAEFIGIGTVILLIVSIFNENLYYSQFRIPILDYLEVSEIIKHSIFSVTLSLIFAIPLIALILYIERLKNFVYYFFIFCNYLAIAICIYHFQKRNVLYFDTLSPLFLMTIFLSINTVISMAKFSIELKKIILLFSLFLSMSMIFSITMQKLPAKVSVYLDDKTIIEDTSYKLVGECNKYIFLYSEKESKTRLIPVSRVVEIQRVADIYK